MDEARAREIAYEALKAHPWNTGKYAADVIIEALVAAGAFTDYRDAEAPRCGAYYGVGDGTSAVCTRPEGHPPISQDGIGHSTQTRL